MLRKIGFVLASRPGERLLTPGIPVHGVVGVLQQVGRLLPREAVGRPRLVGRGIGLGVHWTPSLAAVRGKAKGNTLPGRVRVARQPGRWCLCPTSSPG